MQISLITAVHTAQDTLSHAIASVLAQTHGNWELLLVFDDTLTYQIPDDPRIRCLRSNAPASGPAAARNLALAQARGDFVTWLDADDLITPTRLADLLPLALVHGAACDNHRSVDPARDIEICRLFPGKTPALLDTAHFCEIDQPVIPLVRRDLVPTWDERLGFAEDFLFNLRVLDWTGRYGVHPDASYVYHVHEKSLCHDDQAADRAAESYTYMLEQLSQGDWGLRAATADLARLTISRKHALNEVYRQARAAGLVRHFHEVHALDALDDPALRLARVTP